MSSGSCDRSACVRAFENLEDRRLLAAGDLDLTFGSGGKYLPADHDTPPAIILPTDMAVQSDGRVLVSGLGVHDVGTVFRLTVDGRIDSTFAGGNVLAGSGVGGYHAAAHAVAVGPGGRIAVAGVDGPFDGDPNASTLVVYKPDGFLDKTFDADGYVNTTAFGAGFVDVTFQSDGKILALGKKLVRFNADGSLDKTFGGGDGVIEVTGRKLVLDSSGRIVVLGLNALFRYGATGTPDATFDGDGIRPSVKGFDLAVAPDGDLLVVGNGGNGDQLTRFNANGSIDTAFGSSGNVFVPGGMSLAVNATHIFVGGTIPSTVLPFSDFEIRAYTHAGRADSTFGNGGRVLTDFGLTYDHLIDLDIQRGKLLALGYADVRLGDFGSATQLEPALARYQLGSTAAQSPFNGVPINVTDGVGTTQFDKGGEGVAYHDAESQNLGGSTYRPGEGVDIQYTGNGFHPDVLSFVKAGEWLEYTVNVPATGAYDVNVLASHLKNGGRFHLEIDGKDVTGALTVPNTGDWTTFRNVQRRGVNLTAGTHVLRLAFDANGEVGYVGNFDRIVFNKVVAPGPQLPFYATPARDGQRFEFEDYDRGGEGVAFHDADTLNQGDYGGRPADGVDIESMPEGGENVGYLKVGEWLEYTMDFSQSGPYALDVRLASLGPGGTIRVLVDGIAVTSLTAPDTGAWQTYKTVTRTGLKVTAGRHVVRFQMDSAGRTGYTANLNWFEFRKA